MSGVEASNAVLGSTALIPVLEVVLVVAIALVGWHYVGYPLTIGVLARTAARGGNTGNTGNARNAGNATHASARNGPRPSVAIVLTVYNEGDRIVDRIENCYASTYPSEELRIVVASDGSTDDTVDRVAAAFPDVTVVDCAVRNKARTRHRGVETTDAEVVVFTDAETRFHPDCLERLIDRFADPTVGVVSGSLVSNDFEEGSIGTTMGWYWRWEYFLRASQSDFGLLPKLSGALMAVRRSCYAPAAEGIDLDQTAGLDAVREGYRVVYEPAAVATERFATTPSGELVTRRRLTIQSCTTLWRYRDVCSPRRRPLFTASTVSYWHLRYAIPWLLLAIAVSSVSLAPTHAAAFGIALLVGAASGCALVGAVLDRLGITLVPFSIAFAFAWANAGLFLGTLEFLAGRRVNSYKPI
ncbi:glycosyltransferase [Halorubrum sp. JWXQ-INN 858]|uniref:glycosyltransferase n=1 Tax=Halorubrum sp. JWXQ-INN 858 TaxID=2690782 RepID=UPI00135C687D|nr:glycosyltransferase [Halorubrum sp. JWXQ-INN 858]MWV65241.1 glycosyltransferase [Halorubrum sp. JWXQ-INN 858]